MEPIAIEQSDIQITEDKFQHFTVKLFTLTFRQAAIIKQEMLSLGAEAVVSWNAGSGGNYEAELSGTIDHFQQFVIKLYQQSLGLPEIAAQIEAVLSNHESHNVLPILINQKTYNLNAKTYVMGIINITPDSFSKDGLYEQENYIDRAIRQARQMVEEGADFLDLGAESSRPGAAQITGEEEAKRLLPVLKELAAAVDVPISVDTYKPEVAEAALNYGAAMINDIWGLQSPEDPAQRMARLVGEAKVPVIIMHNKTQPTYQHLIEEIIDFLSKSIEIASNHGVGFQQIIIDPGIGFGKTYHDNLKILQNLDQFKELGRPILLGPSRKSFIGITLDLPVEERLEGTIATAVWGVTKGMNIIRVHDVKAVARAIRMCDAIVHE